MARKTFVSRDKPDRWETPTFEEISVSAEATAYVGAWEDQDWT
jgi:coenzyme PQQ precursor peptide PqqA